MKIGQKVIYKSKIHYLVFEHGNDLYEIQNENQKITLVRLQDLIYRYK